MFLALLLDLGHGIVGGAESGHGLPLLVHHELGEVPLDRVHQEAALLGLNQVLGVGQFHFQYVRSRHMTASHTYKVINCHVCYNKTL